MPARTHEDAKVIAQFFRGRRQARARASLRARWRSRLQDVGSRETRAGMTLSRKVVRSLEAASPAPRRGAANSVFE